MKTTRTRDEILAECTIAAIGCFNHYVDEPMSKSDRELMEGAIDSVLPEDFTTKDWTKEAEEKAAEYKRQDDLEDEAEAKYQKECLGPSILLTDDQAEFERREDLEEDD